MQSSCLGIDRRPRGTYYPLPSLYVFISECVYIMNVNVNVNVCVCVCVCVQCVVIVHFAFSLSYLTFLDFFFPPEMMDESLSAL
jgi:hypothetical protein